MKKSMSFEAFLYVLQELIVELYHTPDIGLKMWRGKVEGNKTIVGDSLESGRPGRQGNLLKDGRNVHNQRSKIRTVNGPVRLNE